MEINNSTFSNNTCVSNGGALMISQAYKLILSYSNFKYNSATSSSTGNGGAIFL